MSINEATPTGTIFGSVVTISNTALGAGVVALPFAMRMSGIIPGIIIFLFVCFIALYTMHLLIICSNKTDSFSYKDIAIKTFGPNVAILFEICIAALCFGILTVYVIVMRNLLSDILSIWFKNINTYVITGVLMLCIIYPLCITPSLQLLIPISSFAIIAIYYIAFFILYSGIESLAKGNIPQIKLYDTNIINVLNVFPTFVFAFGSHFTLLSVYKELKERSTRKIYVAINCSYTIILMLYFFISIFGYITFSNKDNFSSNILLMFDRKYIPAIIAKVSLLILVLFSFPIVNFACKSSINNVIYDISSKNVSLILISTIICILTYLLGNFITDMLIVFGLIMTTTGVMIEFIFPLLFHIKIEENKLFKIFSIILLLLSSIISLICFVLSMYETITGIIMVYQSNDIFKIVIVSFFIAFFSLIVILLIIYIIRKCILSRK